MRTLEECNKEIVRLKLALKKYVSRPDECIEEGNCCVSHAAYLNLVEFVESKGYVWDDTKETYAKIESEVENA